MISYIETDDNEDILLSNSRNYWALERSNRIVSVDFSILLLSWQESIHSKKQPRLWIFSAEVSGSMVFPNSCHVFPRTLIYHSGILHTKKS
jgi:hypothetical protein